MARLDKIHPVISGNKLYKLHYFLKEAMALEHKTLLSFGGAYSNHLVATAFACSQYGLKSIGMVRGERPAVLSPSLQDCEGYGMQLHFMSRQDYRNTLNENFISALHNTYGEFVLVPEGGYSPIGAKGASLIMDAIEKMDASHICVDVGTATTLAGLLLRAKPEQKIIAVTVLKNMNDIAERLYQLTGKKDFPNLQLLDQYHFGGYAKKTAGLLRFMNGFYEQTGIPTDFVYTGKLMYAITDRLKNGFFEEDSRIVCLHTGGLQGNRSLKKGELIY
ncbi:MAG: pyridoxal-phosphate dependent enzyme [Ferruginibacter sp.]